MMLFGTLSSVAVEDMPPGVQASSGNPSGEGLDECYQLKMQSLFEQHARFHKACPPDKRARKLEA